MEKLIRNVLDNEGLAIVVFDTDVSAWDDKEKERLQRLIRTYSNNKRVILCDSMPSIEFWFLFTISTPISISGHQRLSLTNWGSISIILTRKNLFWNQSNGWLRCVRTGNCTKHTSERRTSAR